MTFLFWGDIIILENIISREEFIMKDISPRNAGLVSAILALVIIICIYTALGSVDIVFKQGERQVYRLDDVSVFSELTVPEGDDNVYTYGEEGNEKEFGDTPEFRFHIATTVLLNLVTFKWDEASNIIELNAK